MATMFYPRQVDYIEKLNELADLATGGSLSADNVSITDTAGNFTSTDVEGALAELADDIASATPVAANVSITDSGNYYTGTNVEAALQEVGSSLSGKVNATTIISVPSSRSLASTDSGKILECTSGSITLTMPNSGMPSNFACIVIPNGTTSIASAGTALLNGATATLTRASSSNVMFAIQVRGTSATSYLVTGG